MNILLISKSRLVLPHSCRAIEKWLFYSGIFIFIKNTSCFSFRVVHWFQMQEIFHEVFIVRFINHTYMIDLLLEMMKIEIVAIKWIIHYTTILWLSRQIWIDHEHWICICSQFRKQGLLSDIHIGIQILWHLSIERVMNIFCLRVTRCKIYTFHEFYIVYYLLMLLCLQYCSFL